MGKGEQAQCGQYGDKSGSREKDTQTGDTKLFGGTKVGPREWESGTKPDGMRRTHRRGFMANESNGWRPNQPVAVTKQSTTAYRQL